MAKVDFERLFATTVYGNVDSVPIEEYQSVLRKLKAAISLLEIADANFDSAHDDWVAVADSLEDEIYVQKQVIESLIGQLNRLGVTPTIPTMEIAA